MTAMRLVRLLAIAAIASTLSAAPATAMPPHVPQSGSTPVVQAQANARVNTQAQIYLLRGLANVFSRGMDEIGERLRASGFSPIVINHRGWQNAADTIAGNVRDGNTAPVILIGHSLGANAAFQMAKRLQAQNVAVAYLAVFDPTRRFTVPANVQHFVNFYQNNGHGRPASFSASRRENKVNLNLTTSPGLRHTNIDQSRRLQNIVVERIMKLTAR
jgi:pimeloyl-ACP methyl ester carboxylesterase